MTIFALSTGIGASGVAIIRISGPETSFLLKTLTNLSENHSVSELTDNCLAKNVKRLTHILNENNFSSEDCVLILRTILNKSKRNLKIRIQYEKLNDLEKAMSSSRPPIFWKEKEIVKK